MGFVLREAPDGVGFFGSKIMKLALKRRLTGQPLKPSLEMPSPNTFTPSELSLSKKRSFG
jgi:hypothetical protein